MWRALLGVAVAFLATPPSFATDLLILAGGERRTGVLTSCDDERCQFDQAPVPLADLVWIGLGVGEGELPRGTTAPGAVSVDGTVSAGRLVGISLGAVVLDSGELERAAVRWVRVSAGQPPVDVLIRRDGALRTGALQGCAGGLCTMAGQATSRDDLVWIGLGAEPEQTSPPSPPADPAHDAIQLVDGSTRATPLVGVTAAEVIVGSDRFARTEIAWIYLAPPAAEPGPPVIHQPSRPPQPPAGRPSEPRPPVPPRPPGGEPPRSPETPTPPGTDACDPRYGMVPGSGDLWTGTARMFQSMRGPGWVYEDTSNFEVRLRESCETPVLDLSVTPHRRIGTIIWLDDGGTVQHDHLFEASAAGCPCDGERTFTEPAGPGGAIYRRTGAGDSSAALAFDLPAQPFYSLQISNTGEIIEVPCAAGPCADRTSRSLMQFHAGRYPNVSPETNWDPEMRIPAGGIMRGSYTKPLGPATLEVSWSICRSGVQCPPLPEPEAPPQLPPAGGEEELPSDCDETRGDRAQLDLKMDQLRALLQSLKSAREEHMRIAEQAAQWEGDYEFAMRQCTLWSVARFLVGMLATGAGSGTEIEATKQFWNFLGTIEKVNNGDPSWLLPNHEFKQVFGLSIEDAWDGFTIGYGQLGPSSPAALRQGLEDCAAANIDDVMDGALQYLRLFEQVKPLADQMNKVVNDVVDKDEQIFDFCLSHATACEDYARCR